MHEQDQTSDIEWVPGLLSRRVQMVLPRVEIPLPDNTTVRGRGRLYWDGGDYPYFSAITDRLPESQNWNAAGKIVGSTHEGSTFEISGIGDKWRLVSSCECTDWELPCERVTIRRDLTELTPEPEPQTCQLSGVFDPWPLPVAGRSSTVIDSNPAFGTTDTALDRGQVAVGDIDFVFREVRGACQFRIRAAGSDQIWSSFEAIYAGFNFLFGCRVRLRGWQLYIGPRLENVLLGTRPTAMRRVYPPLDNFLWQMRDRKTGFEQTLALVWGFFLTPIGRRLSRLLYLIWGAADLAIESRLLTAATALEGIVREVEDYSKTPFPYRDDVISYLKARNIGKADLARWLGLLDGTQRVHVPTVLRQWATDGRYQATKEERKAFSKRRHPLAHGSMLANAADPAVKRDLALLMNLINKIMLTQMGYRGPFADYSASRDYNKSCPIII